MGLTSSLSGHPGVLLPKLAYGIDTIVNFSQPCTFRDCRRTNIVGMLEDADRNAAGKNEAEVLTRAILKSRDTPRAKSPAIHRFRIWVDLV